MNRFIFTAYYMYQHAIREVTYEIKVDSRVIIWFHTSSPAYYECKKRNMKKSNFRITDLAAALYYFHTCPNPVFFNVWTNFSASIYYPKSPTHGRHLSMHICACQRHLWQQNTTHKVILATLISIAFMFSFSLLLSSFLFWIFRQ